MSFTKVYGYMKVLLNGKLRSVLFLSTASPMPTSKGAGSSWGSDFNIDHIFRSYTYVGIHIPLGVQFSARAMWAFGNILSAPIVFGGCD